MTTPTHLRQAAVLGAGVMGAQIAAHLVNAGIATLLFELADESAPNRPAEKAIASLKRMKPAPLAAPSLVQHITAANYQEHLDQLKQCDLIIEAIAERRDLKHQLFKRIAPFINDHAVLASNTSGISISGLSEVLDGSLRRRFCGVHFFNPPRYMHLVELIPTTETDEQVLRWLETHLTSTVGKGVIRAKDTPNFIGNRIGVFSMLAAMHHSERLGLAFDRVDAITGPLIGRPKSATYRTADVVGLDTLAHVIGTMAETLPDDPWHAQFKLPSWLRGLIDQGHLGQKSGRGVYQKKGGEIQVLCPSQDTYRPIDSTLDEGLVSALQQADWHKKLQALRQHASDEAAFLWAYFRDLFHYCAYHLEAIADNARDVDLAMRWGYGWELGPFELWQSAGWSEISQWIEDDIKAGRASSNAALPTWVASIDGPYQSNGAYAPVQGQYQGRPSMAVYRRQLYPQTVLAEVHDDGQTVLGDDHVRLWHLGDDIAILTLRSKHNVLSPPVIAGINRAIDASEQDFAALVIGAGQAPFSVGADLAMVADAADQPSQLATAMGDFQTTLARLRSCAIPTVAAVQGMALGGGCEMLMHCDLAVAALESYIGLVEMGVGLIPAGGGLKDLARRAAESSGEGDLFPAIARYFELTAMARVSGSAIEAQQWGLLRPSDVIVMHPQELLYVAKAQARSLAESSYRPPLATAIRIAGRTGIASLKAQLVNMRAGHFISAHDFNVAEAIATVLCGGEIERDQRVDEAWLYRLEREHFAQLLTTEASQARIAHMLKTGKALRN